MKFLQLAKYDPNKEDNLWVNESNEYYLKEQQNIIKNTGDP